MDYAEMVSQIMAAEQGAKVLAEESRARRQQLQAGLEQEISAMRESYPVSYTQIPAHQT